MRSRRARACCAGLLKLAEANRYGGYLQLECLRAATALVREDEDKEHLLELVRTWSDNVEFKLHLTKEERVPDYAVAGFILGAWERPENDPLRTVVRELESSMCERLGVPFLSGQLACGYFLRNIREIDTKKAELAKIPPEDVSGCTEFYCRRIQAAFLPGQYGNGGALQDNPLGHWMQKSLWDYYQAHSSEFDTEMDALLEKTSEIPPYANRVPNLKAALALLKKRHEVTGGEAKEQTNDDDAHGGGEE